MWLNLLKHPERTPALGFYSQENPEVSDWETKWAVEHGISFFVYCWYRTSQGGAVKTRFGSAIHDALFKSRFVNRMKFTLMWENQSRGQAGVADERDLFTNLLPYWMENYFKHPSYLKVDNKPVLFIYRPEFLVDDLGGVTNVAKAFSRMRQVCREAGFDGLYLLGEYRGTDPKHLELMKSLGLDYTFAYCWYVHGSPTPERAIRAQMESIRKTQELNILPQVVTVSQAWSGWQDEGSIWKIPPSQFEDLLRQAKEFTAGLPKDQLGSRMLLLDNWNEWGEGHYIAPYREYGFGYLDAVRRVFSSAPTDHADLLPEDIGRGPYDTAMRAHFEAMEERAALASKHVVKPGAPRGLVAWWTFDEPADSPVALDYSGHRNGGSVEKAVRAPGFDGNALQCDGGSVFLHQNRSLGELQKFTVACRVKTDLANQDNRWIVNSVFGHNLRGGFRLGSDGRQTLLSSAADRVESPPHRSRTAAGGEMGPPRCDLRRHHHAALHGRDRMRYHAPPRCPFAHKRPACSRQLRSRPSLLLQRTARRCADLPARAVAGRDSVGRHNTPKNDRLEDPTRPPHRPAARAAGRAARCGCPSPRPN